jgi:hypothetical protein
MSSSDVVRAAAAELYAADPDDFVDHRDALAARARSAGDAVAAKQISGLRKPTRSAWILNHLARAVPDAADRLSALGAELRDAQRGMDGAAMRELSLRRRALIDELAREAFTAAGQRAPSAAVRDEVTSTLAAAIADPLVAGQLSAGTLTRQERRDGFEAVGPGLTLVWSAPAGQPRPQPSGSGPRASQARTPEAKAERERLRQQAAEQAEADRQRRRREAIEEAEQALATADSEAEQARREEQEQEEELLRLEEQADEARRLLAEASIRARKARTVQRQARQALDRLRR